MKKSRRGATSASKSAPTPLQRLRAADPAAQLDADSIEISVDQFVPPAHSDPRTQARRQRQPRLGRRGSLALAAFAGSAALVTIGIIGLPGSGGGTSAYGVSSRPDGTVEVRLSSVQTTDPKTLQAQLNAAGVRAVVLVESPAGTCNQPRRDGDPSIDKVLGHTKPNFLVIHSTKIPTDAVLLITLPVPQRDGSGGASPIGAMVLRGIPPTCVPQSSFPLTSASPFPLLPGQAPASPAVPVPVPSPTIADGFAIQSFADGGVLILTMDQDAHQHIGELQTALRNAGVPAVVLLAGEDKHCQTQATGAVVPDGTIDSYLGTGTVLRPHLIPAGESLVIALAPNPGSSTFTPAEGIYLTPGAAPTCVASTAAPTAK